MAVGASLLSYFWLPGAMFTLLSRLNHLICQLLLATSKTPSRNPSKAMGTYEGLILPESLPEGHMPSEWGSLSYCKASQGQGKAFIFPYTKAAEKDLIIQTVFYWIFLVCGKHDAKSFTFINLWILHDHMIEAANILLALQMRLLRFRQKAIWLRLRNSIAFQKQVVWLDFKLGS